MEYNTNHHKDRLSYMQFERYSAFILLTVFVLTFLFFFPKSWLIWDEFSYIGRAANLFNIQGFGYCIDPFTLQKIPFNYTSYALGNSMWVGVWLYVFGLKYFHVASLVAVVVSFLLIYKSLSKLKFRTQSVVLLLCFVPLLVLARTVMSGVPSLLIIAVFMYHLLSSSEKKSKWFLLSMLAALSLWLRETNIVLLGGICLVHFALDRRWFWYYVLGAAVGILPRLISSYIVYGDAFHYVLAVPFSISNAVYNLPYYLLLLMVAMPLALVAFFLYKGPYRWEIVISSTIFAGLYVCYGYNPIAYSGFEVGMIVLGRFLIPLLPFYILAVSWIFRNHKVPTLFNVLFTLAIAIMIGWLSYEVNNREKIDYNARMTLGETIGESPIIHDASGATNILRYTRNIPVQQLLQVDISKMTDKLYMDRLLEKYGKVYLLTTINMSSEEKAERTSHVNSIIANVKDKFMIKNVAKIDVKSGLSINVMEVTNRFNLQ